MALPPARDASRDFDFMLGDWTVRHRRRNARLVDCAEWTEFEGLSSTTATLGGDGNVEDNLLHFPEGSYRAVAVRAYSRATGTWSIWWLDGRQPTRLDVPVVGQFAGHIGHFFADDVLDGRPIKMRFLWTAEPGTHPRWEQAFSSDGGKTWETNWTMEFVPIVLST